MSYTYLVGWSKLNKFYYGRRTANGCDPSEFWVSYFTSSKQVKKFYSQHGKPDIIEIRKIFSDHKKCIQWECTVLRRLKVNKSDKWLNLVAGDLNWDTTGWKLPHSTETKANISKAHINRALLKSGYESFDLLFSEVQKLIDNFVRIPEIIRILKISRNLLEKNFPIVKTKEFKVKANVATQERKNKIREKAIGREKSSETRERLSLAHTGKTKTSEHIEKIKRTKRIKQSAGDYDYVRTEEMKQKMRKPKSNTENYKKPKSEEQKRNMSINNHLKIKCSCLECQRTISASLINKHYRLHEKITE